MKQQSDTFAQRTRRLTSEVQRLRDWAGGDPTRLTRVADALVELNAHLLLGHAWAEAAPTAQEAVVLSARVLAQHGPVGPYTPKADAVRSVTALVHLAVLQSAAGLPEGAAQTLAAALGLRDQLSRLALDDGLGSATVAWALVALARVALAAGDPLTANSRADAAASVGGVLDAWLAIDVDRVMADARWAAGHPEPSVEHLLRAVERYDDEALESLQQPAAVPAAMLERLSEPLFGLYCDAADRVLLIGAPGLSLTLRRRLVDLLGTLAVRLPSMQPLLITALSDLADDLRSGGRAAESADVAELAASIAGEDDAGRPATRARTPLGARLSWEPLPPADAFGVQTGIGGQASGRLAALRGPADASEQELRADNETELARRAESAADLTRRAQLQEQRLRAESDRLAAEAAEAARAAQEQAEAAAEAERAENQRRRAARKAEHERRAEREAAEREAALRARVPDETDDERAEREELQRLAAELAALEAAEAVELAQLERELAESEAAAKQEADPLVDEAEKQRLISEEREPETGALEQADLERPETERLAAERVELDRLETERMAAERAELERLSAEQDERERLEAARVAEQQAEVERLRAERIAAEEEAAAREAERERVEAERIEAEASAAAQAEHERLQAVKEQEERAERERREAERAESARAEEERAYAERVAAAQAEQERMAAAERERVKVEEAARLETQRLEAEDLERGERERREADDARRAEQDSLQKAREEVEAASGRREVRSATESLVDELRGRYESDPDGYLSAYLEALDQLATARWQAGDWWGSRAPSRQAKALRKQHGL